jgi:hypothetical protein
MRATLSSGDNLIVTTATGRTRTVGYAHYSTATATSEFDVDGTTLGPSKMGSGAQVSIAQVVLVPNPASPGR